MSVYLIAEAGVNHNGSKELAFKLVDAAVDAGADAIKFQTFNAKALAQKTAKMAAYQKKNLGMQESQLEMLKKLELPHADHFELVDYCREKEIDFLSTPFDMGSVSFLCEDLKLHTIKIPSGELTNAPYLLAIARYGVNIILSTGMATVEEIENALDIIAFGLLKADDPSSFDDIKGMRKTEQGQTALRDKVMLLHCTSEYPAPLDTINLQAMVTLKETFGLNVGMSDHSEGDVVAIGAVALGARLVEKHMTLDKTMEGPDHKASLSPDEMKQMVLSVRKIERAMGTGEKKPFAAELANRAVVRKGIYAARDIAKGDAFKPEDLVIMRPEEGLSPLKYWDLLGGVASRDFAEGDPIEDK